MSQENEAVELSDIMNEYSAAFDKLCVERHEAGAKEYGVFTFLGNDVIRMMAEELADTSNYCRMQFVKLIMLNDLITSDPRIQGLSNNGEEITIGIKAFKGTGEKGW